MTEGATNGCANTAEHLRGLADFVADVDREAVAVRDVDPAEGAGSVATVVLQVDVDALDRETPATPDSAPATPDDTPDERADDEQADDSDDGDGQDDEETDTGDDGDDSDDLTPLEQRTLEVLAEAGEQSSAELVDAYGSDSIRKVVLDLEARGLVNRRKDPADGRRYLYSLADDSDDGDSDGAEGADDDTSDDGAADADDATLDAAAALLDERNLDPDGVAEALGGSQSLREFDQALGVDRDLATTVAGRLGVLEQLAAGGSGVGPDEAKTLLDEVVA